MTKQHCFCVQFKPNVFSCKTYSLKNHQFYSLWFKEKMAYKLQANFPSIQFRKYTNSSLLNNTHSMIAIQCCKSTKVHQSHALN